MSSVAEQTYTPDDLLTDAGWGQIRAGRWPARGAKHESFIELGRRTGISAHRQLCSGARAGLGVDLRAWDMCVFQIAPKKITDSRTSRSCARIAFLTHSTKDGGYVYIPPDLAVEVVSPNDSAYEVENKVVEYLGVGVPLVWVIFPESRTAYVLSWRRLGGQAARGR